MGMLIVNTQEKKNKEVLFRFFIFLNTALIQWLSKKQATIGTSVFGADFVATHIFMETLQGIRYKLRMMGVPISVPSYIYGDNMLVIQNTQHPGSTLKNKSNYIFYHTVHESVAMGESLTGHFGTKTIALTWPPRYCMVEIVGFICQTLYATSMMICEH